MLTQQQHDKVWELIKNIGTTMLVTQDEGVLRSRPMKIIQDTYNGKIWLFTETASAKVFETNADHQVCLTFCDHKNGIHVSLSGKAQLNTDQAKINELWNPVVGAWFEDDKTSNNVSLLEIHVEQGEYWHNNKNTMSQLYEIAKSTVSSNTPDMGEHRKLG